MKSTALTAFLFTLVASPVLAQSAAECSYSRRPAQQIKACTEVLAESGEQQTRALALMNRGIGFARIRKFREAIVDLNASVAADPSNPLSFYNRGNLQYDLRRFEAAREDFGHAIDLDAQFALAYLNRGLANEKLGKSEAAIADFRAALEADPSLKAAATALARLVPGGPAASSRPRQ